ncbi:glycoside hydrolase family 2 protein [Prolixibacteraceae bacterium JC049]|nr:glycoside hydrolase family 2 protein [Prolixibacteraceae bacterium JC049]
MSSAFSKFYLIQFIVLILVVVACSPKENEFIDKQKFNDNWEFVIQNKRNLDNGFIGRTFNDLDWEKVQIPHSPRIESLIVNDQWQGICWYRKSFELPSRMRGKKLYLKFEGAMNVADVWVNGVKKKQHSGGYLPFVVDFSDEALWDEENIVIVRLDNRDNPITGPKPLKNLDFNTYGGIYRNVWLIAKSPLHITDPILANKKASGGVFISYPKVSEREAVIRVQTHVVNEAVKAEKFNVKNTLYRNGEAIISIIKDGCNLQFNEDTEFITEFHVEKPALWSPQFPNLYLLETTLLKDGVVVDKEETKIGIKRIEFRGQELFLNGKKTFLRGVNRHQEYPFIGYALSDKAQYRDAKKIKDAGFDYVRLSHYPHSRSFMDACDELGIVTVDAILGWQYYNNDSLFQKHVFQTARDLIRRDRNHASVLAWEVSLNESGMPNTFIDSLHHIAHEEYPGDQCFSAGWKEYGYDIYLQARQHRLNHYNKALKKPYIVSEYGDWEYYAMNAGLNQDSWENLLRADRSSRQLRTSGEKRLIQQAKNIQEAHNDNFNTPACADGYWIMFDYNRGYAKDLEASGIMDIFRLPKPAYYFYQSQRDAKNQFGGPMVYIASNWNEKSNTNICIYSNCDEIELFLNGSSFGKKQPLSDRISKNLNHPPFLFKLEKFIPGELKAIGYIGGENVAEHIVKTPEEIKDLAIEIDENGKNVSIEDVVFVYVRLLDRNKTVVPINGDKIEVIVDGAASIQNREPIKIEAGIATALIKTNHQGGVLKIKAIYGDFVAEKNIIIK